MSKVDVRTFEKRSFVEKRFVCYSDIGAYSSLSQKRAGLKEQTSLCLFDYLRMTIPTVEEVSITITLLNVILNYPRNDHTLYPDNVTKAIRCIVDSSTRKIFYLKKQ